MRTAIFLIACLLLPAALGAQNMMRMYRMSYSVSGMYASGASTTDIAFTGGTTGTKVDNESVRLSTRNGYFISRNVVFGAEVSWQSERDESQPRPNPANYRYTEAQRDIFIGPLIRWYQPVSMRWFVAPELSVGYRHYRGTAEESGVNIDPLQRSNNAHGVGLNGGIGMGYFLSRHLVLDIAVRYSHHWLSGSHEIPGQPDFDLDRSGGEIGILLGFQLLR